MPEDRFAWTGSLRLSLISSVLLLLGKTKDFVFPSKRRTDEINGSLTGLFQANRSDDIKPGIGIEKNKSTFRVNMYINTKIYSSTNYIESFKI